MDQQWSFLRQHMKRGLKKLLSFFPQCVQEFVEMIFNGAAEYHIKISKTGKQKYTSYTQLKRKQKNLRRALVLALLVVISILAGMLVGPIFFPQPAESEIYIPNGKGEILVSNVSRSQATVIFKTLDGANDNRPLATKSIVEFYEDEKYKDLARRIIENEYAVTHIVAADSLQEGKVYYIKIIAEDSATPVHTKTISTWGGANEAIKVFTSGELIPSCVDSVPEKNEQKENVDEAVDYDIQFEENQNNDKKLLIDGVQNENYLQPKNKIQTIISWRTNLPSTTSISYGEERSGERKQILISEEMVTRHAAILTILKPASVYYFTVESKDENGNVAVSEEYSIKTPRAQENVIQKITNNFKGILKQIKPN